jgi:hypothetical protein
MGALKTVGGRRAPLFAAGNGVAASLRLPSCIAGFGFYRGTGPSDSELAQDNFQRAEARKRGLQQIEPYKGREPEPIRAVVASQEKTGQDASAGKAANDHFHFHNG